MVCAVSELEILSGGVHDLEHDAVMQHNLGVVTGAHPLEETLPLPELGGSGHVGEDLRGLVNKVIICYDEGHSSFFLSSRMMFTASWSFIFLSFFSFFLFSLDFFFAFFLFQIYRLNFFFD